MQTVASILFASSADHVLLLGSLHPLYISSSPLLALHTGAVVAVAV